MLAGRNDVRVVLVRAGSGAAAQDIACCRERATPARRFIQHGIERGRGCRVADDFIACDDLHIACDVVLDVDSRKP